jgi:hypothetical protein
MPPEMAIGVGLTGITTISGPVASCTRDTLSSCNVTTSTIISETGAIPDLRRQVMIITDMIKVMAVDYVGLLQLLGRSRGQTTPTTEVTLVGMSNF